VGGMEGARFKPLGKGQGRVFRKSSLERPSYGRPRGTGRGRWAAPRFASGRKPQSPFLEARPKTGPPQGWRGPARGRGRGLCLSNFPTRRLPREYPLPGRSWPRGNPSSRLSSQGCGKRPFGDTTAVPSIFLALGPTFLRRRGPQREPGPANLSHWGRRERVQSCLDPLGADPAGGGKSVNGPIHPETLPWRLPWSVCGPSLDPQGAENLLRGQTLGPWGRRPRRMFGPGFLNRKFAPFRMDGVPIPKGPRGFFFQGTGFKTRLAPVNFPVRSTQGRPAGWAQLMFSRRPTPENGPGKFFQKR